MSTPKESLRRITASPPWQSNLGEDEVYPDTANFMSLLIRPFYSKNNLEKMSHAATGAMLIKLPGEY
jgi:hypothetical protein